MNDDSPTDLQEHGDGGFLSRWSRRKRELADAPDPQPPAVDADAQRAVEIEPDHAPEPLLTDADMPPIDSLDERSDYSGFLSPGVSRELRQLALRKLFRAASFNITDGLDDYDEDFTSFAKLGDIVTREMRVRDAIDLAREQAKAALAAAESAPAEDAPPVPDDDTESAEPAPAVAADQPPATPSHDDNAPEPAPEGQPLEQPIRPQPTQSA